MLRSQKTRNLCLSTGAILLLAACGGGGGTAAPAAHAPEATIAAPLAGGVTHTVEEITNDPFAVLRTLTADIPPAVTNTNPILDGGELRLGLAATTSITGIWDFGFSLQAVDRWIQWFTHEDLLTVGYDFNPVPNLASATFDRDARTVTLTKNFVSYWHDGVPLTMNDLVFAHEVIAHPDYTGPRWGTQISNVVGAEAYRAGEVDYIEGLVLSDDHMSLTMHFIDFPPTIEAFGFWSNPMPRHHWEGIAVADMEAHPHARHLVLGNGPFIVDAVVPGESVRLIRNDNYWRGRPHLEAVTIEVVEPLALPLAMQQGLFDVAFFFPQSQFTEEFRDMDNVQFLASPFDTNTNTWLGFRMGTWDDETGQVVTWEEPRLSETVRRAIALSIDHVGASQLFNGLLVPNGSTYFGLRRMDWINQNIPTYNHFDPQRAMEMLDEAGYIDVTGDGFRDRPDGTPLVITYMATVGSPANEINRQLEIQNWNDIGLNVVFYQDRLIEANVHLDVRRDETDGGEVDMWSFGWNFGASPDPSGVFGRYTQNNWSRYSSSEWDYIFERFQSDDMWDQDFLLETVSLWEQAFHDTGVFFPTSVAIQLWAVNNRVANLSTAINPDRNQPGLWNPWLWGLTAEQAYVASN